MQLNNNSTWTVAKILSTQDFHNENKGWSRGRKG